ncbi:acetylcholine receptor subunit beta-type unc-29 [Aplysia californica]|uniref:Acetylcholine receptor subunit beta-type unc-29 n=1 Tax=Aplysia californica TaxID=6500 RepID=A0ABM0JH76_APLCA|nr:acetylcholine receptor subunit beta-type unc-29 [Aplysia californica]
MLLDESMYIPPVISHNGQVMLIFSGIIKSRCVMDMRKFPKDTQVCLLVIYSPSFHYNNVSLGTNYNLIWDFLREHGDWLIDNITISVVEKNETEPLQQHGLVVELTILRQPYFYIIEIIGPLIFLSCLNPFAFMLPTDHGERISFSVSLLLSNTVTLASLTDIMPNSSSSMCYISILASVTMFISVSIALLVIITARIATWEGQSTNRQLWICLAKSVRWKKINQVSARGDQATTEDDKGDQREIQKVEREQNESLFRVLSFEDGKENKEKSMADTTAGAKPVVLDNITGINCLVKFSAIEEMSPPILAITPETKDKFTES